MRDTWYAFECRNGFECGAVLDARSLNRDLVDPERADVTCPFCRHPEPMRFRGSWPADHSGYGSRGDPVAYARQRMLDLLGRMARVNSGGSWVAGELREILSHLPARPDVGEEEAPLLVHREALRGLFDVVNGRLDSTPRFDAALRRAREVLDVLPHDPPAPHAEEQPPGQG